MDVIYVIHPLDDFPGRQWYTRVLYNAYPPFRLNFVLDTHVYPCDKNAVRELFQRFNQSEVDISFGNRMTINSVMGAAVLFRAGPGSFYFWKTAFQWMVKRKNGDDQAGISVTLRYHRHLNKFSFRWLSFNWVYASNGVLENGELAGHGRCYRTSLPVNGPVRFVHGGSAECVHLNGKNNSLAYRQRCSFMPRLCATKHQKYAIVFSEEQLADFTHPYPATQLNWNKSRHFHPTDLFWPDQGWK